MMKRKHLGFALNIIAITLFIPGILLPMFSLNMEVQAQLVSGSLTSNIINKELSLLGTIEELWLNQRFFVASLIFIFSIIIPLLKCILLIFAYIKKHTPIEKTLHQLIGNISKWSMADVFVVAIFLAVFSTQHEQTEASHTISFLGFKMQLLMSSETLSQIHIGFYYFVGYCLISLLGCHLSLSSHQQVTTTKNSST